MTREISKLSKVFLLGIASNPDGTGCRLAEGAESIGSVGAESVSTEVVGVDAVTGAVLLPVRFWRSSRRLFNFCAGVGAATTAFGVSFFSLNSLHFALFISQCKQ